MKFTTKHQKKLAQEILDMIYTPNCSIRQIDSDNFILTNDNRHALLFSRKEVPFDINWLFSRFGQTSVFLLPPINRTMPTIEFDYE